MRSQPRWLRSRCAGSRCLRLETGCGQSSPQHAVRQLPWLFAIGLEALNGLKRSKSPTRSKNFRKAAAPLDLSAGEATDRMSGIGKPCFADGRRSARPLHEHVPLVVRTIGATARQRCFDVSPATAKAMPIGSALDTSRPRPLRHSGVSRPRGKNCRCINKMFPDKQLGRLTDAPHRIRLR